jgi:PAS domain S-box-containing protein
MNRLARDPALLAGTLEQASEAMLLVAAEGEGRIEYANPAFALLTGLDPDTLPGRPVADLRPLIDDPGFVSRLLNAVRQAQPYAGEVIVTGASGERLPVDLRVSPFPSGADRPTHWIGLARSLRDRRDLEERLWQAQRLDAVAQLADGVAHDFNNIVVALAGYSRFLLEDTPAGDPRLEDARALERAARRAELLIRYLLAFARRRAIEPELLAPNDVIAELEPVLSGLLGERIVLTTELDPRPGLVRIDLGQLQQMLVNLVTNARDAMPAGGVLTISTRTNVPETPAVVDAGRAYTAHVVITISDTGTGMTREVKAQLFTPFFSTKSGGAGAGLGLATVQRIVEQAGGYVWVQSAEGEGTRVQIALPWAGDVPASPAREADQALPLEGHETVLLVEDDFAVLAVSRRALERYGYRVLAAASSAEASTLAAEHGGGVDLLVSDVVMPGQNGPELAEELRREWPGLKVLFISGYGELTQAGEREVAARGPVLPKPFQPDELARAVRAALDGVTLPG